MTKPPSQRRIRDALRATAGLSSANLHRCATGAFQLVIFTDGEAVCPQHGERLICEDCQAEASPRSSGRRPGPDDPAGRLLYDIALDFQKSIAESTRERGTKLLKWIVKGGKKDKP